jgi:hypothetical protein
MIPLEVFNFIIDNLSIDTLIILKLTCKLFNYYLNFCNTNSRYLMYYYENNMFNGFKKYLLEDINVYTLNIKLYSIFELPRYQIENIIVKSSNVQEFIDHKDVYHVCNILSQEHYNKYINGLINLIYLYSSTCMRILISSSQERIIHYIVSNEYNIEIKDMIIRVSCKNHYLDVLKIYNDLKNVDLIIRELYEYSNIEFIELAINELKIDEKCINCLRISVLKNVNITIIENYKNLFKNCNFYTIYKYISQYDNRQFFDHDIEFDIDFFKDISIKEFIKRYNIFTKFSTYRFTNDNFNELKINPLKLVNYINIDHDVVMNELRRHCDEDQVKMLNYDVIESFILNWKVLNLSLNQIKSIMSIKQLMIKLKDDELLQHLIKLN